MSMACSMLHSSSLLVASSARSCSVSSAKLHGGGRGSGRHAGCHALPCYGSQRWQVLAHISTGAALATQGVQLGRWPHRDRRCAAISSTSRAAGLLSTQACTHTHNQKHSLALAVALGTAALGPAERDPRPKHITHPTRPPIPLFKPRHAPLELLLEGTPRFAAAVHVGRVDLPQRGPPRGVAHHLLAVVQGG